MVKIYQVYVFKIKFNQRVQWGASPINNVHKQ